MSACVVLTLISVCIYIVLLYNIKFKIYTDYSIFGGKYYYPKEFKIKLPIWFYLVTIVCLFIPLFNIMEVVSLCVLLVIAISDEALYYKKGWFIELLTKTW